MTAVFSQTIGHFAVPHVSTLLCVVLLSLRAHMAAYSTVTSPPPQVSTLPGKPPRKCFAVIVNSWAARACKTNKLHLLLPASVGKNI